MQRCRSFPLRGWPSGGQGQAARGGSLAGDELNEGLVGLAVCVGVELSGQHEAHPTLDVCIGQGGAPLVADQAGGLISDALKQISHEAVQDGLGLLGQAEACVNFPQKLREIDGKGRLLAGAQAAAAAAVAGPGFPLFPVG